MQETPSFALNLSPFRLDHSIKREFGLSNIHEYMISNSFECTL